MDTFHQDRETLAFLAISKKGGGDFLLLLQEENVKLRVFKALRVSNMSQKNVPLFFLCSCHQK